MSSAPDQTAEAATPLANVALGLNAAFCNVVGLVFTLTGAFMADWLGVAGWVATVFGVVVLLWSFVITLFANRRFARRSEVDFVIKTNVILVVVAIVVVLIPDAMTTAGKTMVVVGAGIVGLFALAQFGSRRSLTPPLDGPDPEDQAVAMNDPEIIADAKDWTWVLTDVCTECEYDVRSFPKEQTGSLIRENAAAWQALIAGQSEVDLRQRPRPDKWSALEYSAHVRDVYRLYDHRLGLMLDEDGPSYPNWDQDETAIAEQYNTQDPATVSSEVAESAAQLARRFDALVGDQWQRTGYRSDGAAFTVESFARYLIHDPVHHLWDVGQRTRQ